MDNSGTIWSKNEEEQLQTLYVNYKVNIPELSKIHKRPEEEIRIRLIRLNLLINEDNFIQTEVEELKNENGDADGMLILTEVISKHLNIQQQKINVLELKVKILTDQIDKMNKAGW